MRSLYLFIFTALILLLNSCTEDILTSPIEVAEENVQVSFQVNIPVYKTVKTRAVTDENAINSLYLMVFNENGDFIKRVQATSVSPSSTSPTSSTGTFTAILPKSSKKRIIHFISNYNWSSFNDAVALNKNEGELIPSLYSEASDYSGITMNMWARKELTSGINAISFGTSNPVNLIRNMAKITVVNNAANFTNVTFAVHNTSRRGSISPFNTNTYQFTEGVLTEPAGTLFTLNSAFTVTGAGNPHYIYERRNKTSGAGYTSVIVKGTYNGTTRFYKLDLIDESFVRYDIERNYHYRITINVVLKEGYNTLQEALDGAASNNISLDPTIEKYPIISDGISKLEVDKTLHIFTSNGSTLSAIFKYFPNVSNTTMNNSGVTVQLIEDDLSKPVVNGTLSVNNVAGTITANIFNVPTDGETRSASIIVKKGELSRTIRLILRPAYKFTPITINNANPASIATTQGTSAVLRFYIPDDYPDELLPLDVKIKTQGLTANQTGLRMEIVNGNIYYIHTANTKGLQTVQFKTNLSTSGEAVLIEAERFEIGNTGYNMPTIALGSITYGASIPVPGSSTLQITANRGSIEVIGNGQYRYIISGVYNTSDAVSITYIKVTTITNGTITETYSTNTTVGAILGGTINLATISPIVIEGTIEYRQGSWNNVPSNGTVSIPTGPGTIVMTGTGTYKYTLPANTANDTNITFRYRRSNTNYDQTKTFINLKSDAGLRLQ